MALKETLYDHHPVRTVEGLALGTEQVFGGILVLAPLGLNAPIFELENMSTTGWDLYSVDASEDYTPPRATVAVLLDVACRDVVGPGYYVSIATPGIIYGSKTQIVYCGDITDGWNSRLVLAELNDKYEFTIKVDASVGGLDAAIKLIGWLVDPSITRPSPPSKDLFAYFVVGG